MLGERPDNRLSMGSSAKSIMIVTAAVIVDGDRLLIAQRKPDATMGAGLWEFPGGKLEFLETPEAGLTREIHEELSLEIEVGPIADTASHVFTKAGAPAQLVLLIYWCKLRGPDAFKLVDVADAKWISYADLGDYTFAEADRVFVAKLQAGLRAPKF